jgi:hypothetical protein
MLPQSDFQIYFVTGKCLYYVNLLMTRKKRADDGETCKKKRISSDDQMMLREQQTGKNLEETRLKN